MPDADEDRSLERASGLVVASVYEREVPVSLERVWENVYDWEHLPWLHREAFASIDLLTAGDWGWEARVGFPGGAKARIELVADREAGCYVARTLEGAGAPSEIWTTVTPNRSEATGIRVEFCVSEMPGDALRALGRSYRKLYTQLWDQDEGMMRTRHEALTRRGEAFGGAAEKSVGLSLGTEGQLRTRGPFVFELGGHRFRLVEILGEWVAHSTECPHWGGPLEGCEVVDGEIACPWHGYRFDVRGGKSADQRSLRLRPAPRIEIDAKSGEVWARAAANSIQGAMDESLGRDGSDSL